ncbi:unnamed protein product [Phyllotreta striolata]|uniref:Uncharacterized protein n=1 Tax=Phyllotreta striolata TaxID=444603 RepID=A0A9N9XRT8_PHYSR|nr:unnamed protein product [Phyllotreta striolata]
MCTRSVLRNLIMIDYNSRYLCFIFITENPKP